LFVQVNKLAVLQLREGSAKAHPGSAENRGKSVLLKIEMPALLNELSFKDGEIPHALGGFGG